MPEWSRRLGDARAARAGWFIWGIFALVVCVIVAVQPDGVWYYNVTDENIDRIVEQHLKDGEVVEDLVFHLNGSGVEAC